MYFSLIINSIFSVYLLTSTYLCIKYNTPNIITESMALSIKMFNIVPIINPHINIFLSCLSNFTYIPPTNYIYLDDIKTIVISKNITIMNLFSLYHV